MKGLGHTVLIVFLAGCLGLGCAGYSLYRHVVRAVDRRVEAVEAVEAVFQNFFHATPHLVVARRPTAWAPAQPIAEFAVLSREGEFSEEWRQTRMLSTKKVVITARCVAKAGFDLNREFTVDVDHWTGRTTVTLPPPKILSVELAGDYRIHGENGLVNWLSDADLAEALRFFRAAVRSEMENSGLPEQAGEAALRRLDALAAEAGQPIAFRIRRVGGEGIEGEKGGRAR